MIYSLLSKLNSHVDFTEGELKTEVSRRRKPCKEVRKSIKTQSK
jgi:hypothetical protein